MHTEKTPLLRAPNLTIPHEEEPKYLDAKVVLAAQRWIFHLPHFQQRLRLTSGVTYSYEQIVSQSPKLQNIHFYSDVTDENFAPVAQALSASKVEHITFVKCHNFHGTHLKKLKNVRTLCFYYCDQLKNLDLTGCAQLERIDLAGCPNTHQVSFHPNTHPAYSFWDGPSVCNFVKGALTLSYKTIQMSPD